MSEKQPKYMKGFVYYGMDAGEKMDKFSMVTTKLVGDYKAPVPQNAKYVVVKVHPNKDFEDMYMCKFLKSEDL